MTLFARIGAGLAALVVLAFAGAASAQCTGTLTLKDASAATQSVAQQTTGGAQYPCNVGGYLSGTTATPITPTTPLPMSATIVPAGMTAHTCYGNLSSTTSATQICAAPGAGKAINVAQLNCWNSSGSTITVLLNDVSSTQIIIPQTFGNNLTYPLGIPLTVATNTQLTGAPSASVANAGCGASVYY